MSDQLHVLSEEECLRLLNRGHFGRVGLIDGDRPVILPVNYVFDEGSVVFQSAAGTKLEAASAGRLVSFQIDAVDPMYHGGFSVLVFGRAEAVDAPAEIERLATLPLRPWWPAARDRWIRIHVDEITGRRLRSDPL